MFRISRLATQGFKTRLAYRPIFNSKKIPVSPIHTLIWKRNFSCTIFNPTKDNENKDQLKMEIEDDLEVIDPQTLKELLPNDELENEEIDNEWFVDPECETLTEKDFIPLWQRRTIGEHMEERLALQKTSKELMESGKLTVEKLGDLLEESKMDDIKIINVSEKCDWADYMIIASSSKGDKYLSSVAEHVNSVVKKAVSTNPEKLRIQSRIEGRDGSSGWLLIDLGRIIIHLFTPEMRKTYDLEGLWDSISTDPTQPLSIKE
ncbi:Oligomerization domain-containing protein [Cokeromyces recurvatus]|uniref:Oligomerization domain-containing protein n=1 Tax=Cokeromyces recurvatus TaxID=90255 RepID=UPI0022203A18|nr:Oligomerization domain-containing protein [Cokeromyces recurvatus]KAI7901070.1 Oligomerization domain-containing protein [Cokeromyces recurvatus]